MADNHIIVKALENGYVLLKAKKGYKLYSIALERVVAEAIVKTEQIKDFKAVK